MKLKKWIRNDRGDMTIGAIFLILALNMLIAFLLLFTSIQIQCANIRSSAKMELNNLSAVIAEDTFTAMREGNLQQYEYMCNSTWYYQKLQVIFKNNLSEHLVKDAKDYRIYNERISVYRSGDKMRFVYSCTIQFKISMFGKAYPTITKNISITGSHNTKF